MSPAPSARPENEARIVGVATRDPFDVRTFSGYSAHMFRAIEDQGTVVVPVVSRSMKVADALTGAVNPVAVMRRGPGRPDQPKIRPNWYWSRRTFERFCRRFDRELSLVGTSGVLLQVGTHVRTTLPGYRSFCVTDATVAQTVGSTRFSVDLASDQIIGEAIACQREVFHSCEKVFVLSQWAADSVTGDYDYPAEQVVVVGAGANLPARVPRRLDAEHPYVLFVGIDWERKGGPLLLDAFRRVRASHPSARLVIVGCTPEVTDDGVEVVGYLDKDDAADRARLLDLYAGATCFALLSDLDPFPNVILEAAYLGVPAVSTNEGSRPELIVDGETGVLVDRDVDEIAGAIVDLLADAARADAMGRAAQRRVEARFTWPAVSHHILSEMGLSPAAAN